jgi:Zn-dependent protease
MVPLNGLWSRSPVVNELCCEPQAIEVTDYAPMAWWVPMGLPHVLEQLLAYTFSVSAALALLNMAPVYGLDGEAALKSLFQLGDPREGYFREPPSRLRGGLRAGRRLVRLGVLNLGTAIFGFLLSLHVLRLTGYDAMLMRTLATVRHLLTFSVRWG